MSINIQSKNVVILSLAAINGQYFLYLTRSTLSHLGTGGTPSESIVSGSEKFLWRLLSTKMDFATTSAELK